MREYIRIKLFTQALAWMDSIFGKEAAAWIIKS